MPRFVLLYHHCPAHYERPSHWDLMLEAGEALRTWALTQLPSDWNALRTLTAISYPACPPLARDNTVVAEQLADHRLDYLENEGPLTGNRGAVSRVDCGTYESSSKTPNCLRLTIAGDNWRGKITLEQTGPAASRWNLAVSVGSGGA
jgi:DNA polymerase Ligase (LigD)